METVKREGKKRQKIEQIERKNSFQVFKIRSLSKICKIEDKRFKF